MIWYIAPRRSRLFYYHHCVRAVPTIPAVTPPRSYVYLFYRRAAAASYVNIYKFLWGRYVPTLLRRSRFFLKRYSFLPSRLRFTPGLYRFLFARRIRILFVTPRRYRRCRALTRSISLFIMPHSFRTASILSLQSIFFFTKYFFLYKVFFVLNGTVVYAGSVSCVMGDVLSFILTYRFFFFLVWLYSSRPPLHKLLKHASYGLIRPSRHISFTINTLLHSFVLCERDWWAGCFLFADVHLTPLTTTLPALARPLNWKHLN